MGVRKERDKERGATVARLFFSPSSFSSSPSSSSSFFFLFPAVFSSTSRPPLSRPSLTDGVVVLDYLVQVVGSVLHRLFDFFISFQVGLIGVTPERQLR